ncbi:S8 family serine peptidase [Streptomyces rimosus]|uniref:S8 family serine peptidase n=1 Tax=Streptomyces rimosus TaxID=1927 RepID=UPI003788F96A
MGRKKRLLTGGAARAVARSACAVVGGTSLLLGLSAPTATAEGMRERQWYLDAMQAEKMWRIADGSGVTVAVIDSGVDASLPDLRGQVLPGTAPGENAESATEDRDGHGTNMALLISGKGTAGGIKGLAPGAKILPVKAYTQITDKIARSIRYAADRGAKVINVSVGGIYDPVGRTQIKSAAEYAAKKGSLIFASAGNDGDKGNRSEAPADVPGVVAVAAVDQTLSAARFSSHGPHVALAAPGVEIPERCTQTTGYCAGDGTSQAGAIASASAALIWSAHPDWTNNQVLRVMLETAGKPKEGKVPSQYIGYGIVRPRKVLLDKEGAPGPADVNPLLSGKGDGRPTRDPNEREKGERSDAAQNSDGNKRVDDRGERTEGSSVWVITAVAAGLAGALVLAALLIRRRRKRGGVA